MLRADSHVTGKALGMIVNVPQVFISYQRTDSEFARHIRAHLVRHGVRTWMDQDDVPVGAYWPDAIDAGLTSSDIVLGILSPDAITSRNVKNKWDWAIQNGKRLVLLRIAPTVIPHRYVSIHFIDATGPDLNQALATLLHSLGVNEPATPADELAHPLGETPRFCSSCGARRAPGAGFCNQCGAAVVATSTTSTPPTPAASRLPAAFVGGRYTVQRFLCEGPSKRVYACRDTVLDRDVAFALLKADGLDPTVSEQLRRAHDRVHSRLVRRGHRDWRRQGPSQHLVDVDKCGESQGARTWIGIVATD